MKRCICGKRFEPDEDFHYLCGDCWDERGRLGDIDSPLPLISKLGNGRWTREELEEISDSPLWQKFTEEVIDEMDLVMRAKWILKLAERHIK